MAAPSIPELWPGKSLYEIIGVDKTATTEAIKKAYYKQALKFVSEKREEGERGTLSTQRRSHSDFSRFLDGVSCCFQHPDKAGDDPDATKRFQALCAIHAILSDNAKRGDYDRTGEIPGVNGDDGEINEEAFAQWYDYFRAQFPPVTEEDVKAFEDKYRGSEEEKGDVLKAYTSEKGDIDEMLGVVMCSREEDADRFAAIIHEALAAKKVKAFPAFTRLYGNTAEEARSAKYKAARAKVSKERKQIYKEEAEEAEAMLAELKRQFKEDQEEQKKARASGTIVAYTGTGKKGGAGAGAGAGGAKGKKGKSSAAMDEDDDEEEEEEDDGPISGKKRKHPTSSSAGAGAGKKKANAGAGRSDDGGYNGEPSLADLIRFQSRQRGSAFASMVEGLEAKYGGGAKGKGKDGKGKGKGGKKGAAFDSEEEDDEDEDDLDDEDEDGFSIGSDDSEDDDDDDDDSDEEEEGGHRRRKPAASKKKGVAAGGKGKAAAAAKGKAKAKAK